MANNRSALSAIGDPIERAVSAIGRFAYISSAPGAGSKQSVYLQQIEPREVVQEVWPSWNLSDLNTSPPWTGQEIARWFADRARRDGIKPDGTAQWETWPKGLLGKQKRRISDPEPAWRFEQRSTQGRGDGPNSDAFVFADGRFMPSAANYPSPDSYTAQGNLGALVLIGIARILKLV